MVALAACGPDRVVPGRYPGFLKAARLRLVTQAARCWTARGRQGRLHVRRAVSRPGASCHLRGRATVLAGAYHAHPERFARKPPAVPRGAGGVVGGADRAGRGHRGLFRSRPGSATTSGTARRFRLWGRNIRAATVVRHAVTLLAGPGRTSELPVGVSAARTTMRV